MTLGPGRLVVFCGLLPTLAAAVLSLTRPAAFRALENGTYDILLRAAPTVPPGDRIVIVDIDDRSLTTIGQWPWRRDVLGQLVNRLRDAGAAIVALDIIFAEPDRYDGESGSTDEMLAATLREGGVVLGYALTFDESDSPPDCVQHPVGLPVLRQAEDGAHVPVFQATGAICNLPVLTDSSTAAGFLNAAPDPDGLLRRAPLLMEYRGRLYPSLALASVAASTGAGASALRIANVNTSVLMFDDGRAVALDGRGNLLLRFRGPKRTFPYVSAVDVLLGNAGPDTFAGRIAFVGTTALGTREVVSTPLDTLFAGVEVQATVADNLLQQDIIHRTEHGTAIETQAVIVFGLVAALLVRRFGLAAGAAGVAALILVLWVGAEWLLARSGVFLSPLFPTMGIVGALATMTAARFAIERRRADRAGEEKETSQKLMVQALLSLTAVRDAETGRHSARTQQYARLLAEELSRDPKFRAYLTPERIELLSSLAPLHDIGKVGVPDRLLNKPGQLTADELLEMQQHPRHGRDVIVQAQQRVGVHDDAILGMAKDIVYTHHEKWDGTGYPEGLCGTEIPIPGRVMSVVDVYDACTTRTLYRTPLTHEEAVALIVRGRGTHFDPDVVDAFLEVSAVFRRFSGQEEGAVY